MSKVEAELARGVDVNWKHTSCNGWTSLMVAAVKGRDAVVQRLLRHPGINVNTVDNIAGHTALHWACYTGEVESTRLLLAARGQSYNLKTTSGYTPLMWAIMQDKIDCVKLLVQVEEVDLETRDNAGASLDDMAR